MTKRMIDADALLECLGEINIFSNNRHKDKTIIITGVIATAQNKGFNRAVEVIIEKINELAKPVPEPQESIFDDDGWLDIKTAPHCTPLIVYDHVNKLSAVSTYRPSYSSNHGKNWRDAWDYSKGIGFIPTKWRRPMPNIPKEVKNDKTSD